MIFLLFSIICSVTVGVLFKIVKNYNINLEHAITWNYLFAILLSIFCFKPAFATLTYHPTFAILGFLMPAIFIVLSKSVKTAGLAKTDIAQRLSLFISLGAAFFLFKESFDTYKNIGVLFGFAAILLTMYRKSDDAQNNNAILYLLLTFTGFGVVDILFKIVSQITNQPYTSSLFLIYITAFVVAFIALIVFGKSNRQEKWLKNFAFGAVLGLFNFGNILFYLKAHKAMANNPSTVFAAMNIGVILVGSVIGILAFKEKLSKWNYLGLLFAVISILFITLSKIYAV